MFHQLIDQVLRLHDSYAVAYLDDSIIYSRTWENHLKQVTAILQSLKAAVLMENPY